MMGGMPWIMMLWTLVWGLVGVAVLVAAALGVLWLVRQMGGGPAERELRRRYAAGQIDDEEFRRRLDTLRGSGPPVR